MGSINKKPVLLGQFFVTFLKWMGFELEGVETIVSTIGGKLTKTRRLSWEELATTSNRTERTPGPATKQNSPFRVCFCFWDPDSNIGVVGEKVSPTFGGGHTGT